MRSLKRLAPVAVSLACLIPQAVQAQGIQNWINNEVNKINSSAAAGAITAGQAQQLDSRALQIQQQEQMYAAQNGGRLTGGEQRQISRELRGLNHGINRDAQRDAQAAYGYGMPGLAGIPGGLSPGMTPAMYWQNLAAQQANWTATQQAAWAAQNPALAAQMAQWRAARQAQYSQTGYNGYHHHHHDHGNWGAQYGGGGGGYWNH